MAEMIDARVGEYLESLVPRREGELRKMEERAKEDAFPIIGPAAGQLCYLLARSIGARRVFELGSGFGYSTAWFARAVEENGGGEVHHTVWDEELSARARAHLQTLGYSGLIRFHVAEAVETLRGAEGHFDIVFNDIDKEHYPASLDVIRDKLRDGGLLIIDNMLWRGRIFDPADQDVSTEGVREFTARITDEPGWIVSLLPIRDGLIVAMKV